MLLDQDIPVRGHLGRPRRYSLQHRNSHAMRAIPPIPHQAKEHPDQAGRTGYSDESGLNSPLTIPQSPSSVSLSAQYA